INTNNTNDGSGLRILGIVPTDLTEDTNLVTQATPGSKVRLHGIINTNNFAGGTFAATNVKFNASVVVSHKYKVGVRYAETGPYDYTLEDEGKVKHEIEFSHNK